MKSKAKQSSTDKMYENCEIEITPELQKSKIYKALLVLENKLEESKTDVKLNKLLKELNSKFEETIKHAESKGLGFDLPDNMSIDLGSACYYSKPFAKILDSVNKEMDKAKEFAIDSWDLQGVMDDFGFSFSEGYSGWQSSNYQ